MEPKQLHCKVVEHKGYQILFRLVFVEEDNCYKTAISLWTEEGLFFEIMLTPKKEHWGEDAGMTKVLTDLPNMNGEDAEFAIGILERAMCEAAEVKEEENGS